MSTVSISRAGLARKPQLHSGDRMTRQEFHEIYQQMPAGFKAELIGGIVYVASPVRIEHGEYQALLCSVMMAYRGATTGVQCCDNTTIQLNDDSEPQPDLFLRILPAHGGQSSTTPDSYVSGGPEFVAEIAHSSRAIDLHAKREDYARNGVLEYLVASVGEKQLRWFDLHGRAELRPDADGIYRIRTMPGLWINASAFFALDQTRLMATLHEGLAAREHADFVARLTKHL